MKNLFSRGDIKEALLRARADERQKCEREKNREIAKAVGKVINDFTLRLKEKEAEMSSLNLRLENIERRERAIEKKKQEIWEIEIKQRHIASDMVKRINQSRDEELKISQGFAAIETDAKKIEARLLDLEKIK